LLLVHFTLPNVLKLKCDYGIITDMEPNVAGPERTPGQLPKPIEFTPAQQPEALPSQPERSGEVSPEVSHEQQLAAVQAASAQQASSLSLPIAQPQQDDTQNSDVSNTSTLSAAVDEDVIEKERVDRAKQIITDTKDDPHAREEEVGKLQADYLEKRYGKKLGSSE
jgi:hypothetical protein